jgi:hypothetical protein
MLGWRSERGETALVCRLIDGSAGTIPARWTDLPAVRGERPLGVVGSPAAWRLLAARLGTLRARRPRPPAKTEVRVEGAERACASTFATATLDCLTTTESRRAV